MKTQITVHNFKCSYSPQMISAVTIYFIILIQFEIALEYDDVSQVMMTTMGNSSTNSTDNSIYEM